MSEGYRLALDVDAFETFGAVDDPIHGAPREVESNENIHEWTAGLRAGGGGGYVFHLKYTCLIV